MGVHGGNSNPRADGEDNAEQDRHAPELGQVPLDGRLAVGSVVVGDGEGGDISENGNEDDELDVQAAVEDGNPQTQVDLEMDRQRDTVDDVGVHAVENLAGGLEGIDDGTETGGKEDDIGGGAGGVGGTLDGNTSIGLLERGGVVDTVTGHGNQVATLLQDLDDVVLVLGEDLGETIGSLDEIVDLRAGHVTTATETEALSVVDVGAEAELAGSLAGNADGVTSKHLDGQTETLGLVDGAGGIVAGGIGAGHDAENLPGALTALAGDTERAEATGGELGNLVLVGLVNLIGDGVVLLDGLENEQRGTLDADNALALGGLDDGGDLLGDGVEGVEVEDLVLAEDTLGAGVVLERLEESLVDGIHTLLLARGSQAGSEHEVLGVDTGDGVGLGQGELVLGQSTGLVGAQNLDTSERLDGGQLLDDSLLLGEVGGTDGHGGGDDGGETDGHTDDGDGQGELEDGDNGVGAVEAGNPDDQVGENDEDEEDGADAVEHLGEVTSTGRGGVYKGGGTTNKGVVTGGGDDHESLATLDGGRGIALVTLVLVDGERLAGDGGLIDLEIGIVGDDAAIGGDDGTLLNLEDIAGNDLGGLDLLQGAVTEDDSLERKSPERRGSSQRCGIFGGRGGFLLLELVHNGTSLVFLNETDNRVEKQKTANNTEINPVLKTGGNCEHDVSGSFQVALDWPAVFAASATPTPAPLAERARKLFGSPTAQAHGGCGTTSDVESEGRRGQRTDSSGLENGSWVSIMIDGGKWGNVSFRGVAAPKQNTSGIFHAPP